MANSDVTVTLAAKFPNSIVGPKDLKALTCLFRYMAINSAYTKPTQASWDALIRTSNALLPKPQGTLLDAVRAACWLKLNIDIGNTGITTATSTLSDWLDAIGYLRNFDMDTLETLNTYLEGVQSGSLS